MDPLLNKLNFKTQKSVYVINAPESLSGVLKSFSESAELITKADKMNDVEFALAFVTTQEQINEIVPKIAPQLTGDAILWMCYPKSSSKKYKCDFNRNSGWNILGKYELEGVRQVAIDEDWSALRFRKVEYIKTMKRKFSALSDPGKKKAGQD
jgi:hypothetical protein